MSAILIINGPNLNLLGAREPEHYGHTSLEDINLNIKELSDKFGYSCETFQSNAEHKLIEKVQDAPANGIDFIIINPAAFTHTSVGLRDALQAVGIPFIEIHLSNIFAREDFRKESFFSDIAVGVISGLGPVGYELALTAAVRYLDEKVKCEL